MGYASQLSSAKTLTSGEDIAPGSIGLEHLSPTLFSEIRQVNLHNHSGVKSRKIAVKDLSGAYGKDGFYMYSSTGSKRFKCQISDAGAWVLTEA